MQCVPDFENKQPDLLGKSLDEPVGEGLLPYCCLSLHGQIQLHPWGVDSLLLY